MSLFREEPVNDVRERIRKSKGSPKEVKKSDPVDEIYELNCHSQKIQELIGEIDSLDDKNIRGMMQECVQELLGFYGLGLHKILKIISNGSSSAAKDIYNNLIADSFISGLLLIHDLHPLDLNTRLHAALEKVKPYMDSHGGSVEIVSLENGVARLKLSGHCKGCPSSASTLQLGIKEAIEENCPDLLGLEVEGVVSGGKDAELKPLSFNGWHRIEQEGFLHNGDMKMMELSGIPLFICRVNNKMYAYRNLCPACGLTFNNGKLENSQISCHMGHRFNIQLAGKSINDPEVHLDPFLLIEEEGTIKIAVG